MWDEVTLTSLKLRAYGGDYTTTWGAGQLDFPDFQKEKFSWLVLKDGSRIQLGWRFMIHDTQLNGDKILLEEIRHLELMDASILYPQNPE